MGLPPLNGADQDNTTDESPELAVTLVIWVGLDAVATGVAVIIEEVTPAPAEFRAEILKL